MAEPAAVGTVKGEDGRWHFPACHHIHALPGGAKCRCVCVCKQPELKPHPYAIVDGCECPYCREQRAGPRKTIDQIFDAMLKDGIGLTGAQKVYLKEALT